MPSICFVAGDPSGDAHAARLIEALRTRDRALAFAGLGGPAMQHAGMALLDDLTVAAAIGPFDAARHWHRLRRAAQLLDEHLTSHRPDLVVLVDFGDFNLPIIAPLVKRHRIPTLYYISPQLWAWGRWRLRYVRRYIDRMVVFFKFEEAFYQRAGVPVTWVGHPLVDEGRASLNPEAAIRHFGLNPWRRTVGLLPGSRVQELERHLPLLLDAARRIAWHLPGVQFLLPKAPALSRAMLERLLPRARADVRIAQGPVYDALQLMETAVIASGTATLEAAVYGVPMVVVYRTSWPTYLAARAVIRIPHIALVNVVAGREVVPELVQRQATPERIAQAMMQLLRSDERCDTMRRGLQALTQHLGPPGAVERAAAAVREELQRTRAA